MAEQIILGENVIVQFKDLSEPGWSDFVCATDCSIETEVETKSTKTIGDGVWKRKKGQSIGWKINLNGIVKLFDEQGRNSSFNVQQALMGFVEVETRMVFTDPESTLIRMFYGFTIVTASTFTGPVSGFSDSSFTLEGTGPLEILDSFIGCSAAIGSAGVSGAGEGDVNVSVYDCNIDTVRIDYTVDGGDRLTVFPTSGDVNFFVLGLSEGPHQIILYPICSNGEDGTPYPLDFEIAAGGCVEVAIPGSPILPNGTVGVPYTYSFGITGTAPFVLDNIVKPSWMTIDIVGDEVRFTGTPDAAGLNTPVSFDITNCSAGLATFNGTITTIDPAFQEIAWDFTKVGFFNGNFKIDKNFVTQVNETLTDSGTVSVTGGDDIDITVTGPAGTERKLKVTNETTSTVLTDQTTSSGNILFSFTVNGTDSYSVVASVIEI